MAAEAFIPSTTIIEPGITGLPRWYVSTREVPAEWFPPAKGETLGDAWGSAYSSNIVMIAEVSPQSGKRIASVTHCSPSAWYALRFTSKRVTEDGVFLSVRQVVPTPTQEAIEADPWSTYEVIDEAKSLRVTLVPRRKKTDGTYEDGYPLQQIKSKGTGPTVPGKFRKFITTVVTTVKNALDKANVNSIPVPATPTGNQVLIENKKLNDEQYETVITEEVIDEVATPLPGQQTGTWGTESTEESLVVEGTAIDDAFRVKQSEVSPIGNGKAVKKTVMYPSVQSTGIVYTLEREEQDESTGIVIDMKNQLVDASQAKALSAAARVDQWFTDIKPADKRHSILICAKVNAASVTSQTWLETANISLPSTLEEAGVIWDSTIDGDFSSSGIHDVTNIIANNLSWSVAAQASASGAVYGRPYTKVKAGITGAAKVSVTRTFSYGPPVTAITSRRFQSVYGYITIHGEQAQVNNKAWEKGYGDTLVSDGGSNRNNIDSKVAIHQFGPVEHNGITTLTSRGDSPTVTETYESTGGSTPDGGAYPVAVASLSLAGNASLELPASTIPLVSGDTYILHVVTRPWRLGWWVREVYTATVP